MKPFTVLTTSGSSRSYRHIADIIADGWSARTPVHVTSRGWLRVSDLHFPPFTVTATR